MPELLMPEAARTLINEVPCWELKGDRIERVIGFDSFLQAIDFVNRLAAVAEERNHHPDIDIRWNKVRLVLSTHSAGGLTDKDFTLARKIDELVPV
jgi:4a-hydroxytetrahydrobiopterin dehydratase